MERIAFFYRLHRAVSVRPPFGIARRIDQDRRAGEAAIGVVDDADLCRIVSVGRKFPRRRPASQIGLHEPAIDGDIRRRGRRQFFSSRLDGFGDFSRRIGAQLLRRLTGLAAVGGGRLRRRGLGGPIGAHPSRTAEPINAASNHQDRGERPCEGPSASLAALPAPGAALVPRTIPFRFSSRGRQFVYPIFAKGILRILFRDSDLSLNNGELVFALRRQAETHSRNVSAVSQDCSTFSVSRSSARVRPRLTAAMGRLAETAISTKR